MALLDVLGNPLVKENTNVPEHFIDSGTTGTSIYSGYFSEEYLGKFLQMPEGIKTYDEMRRSDSQIQMLLNAVKIPIISANWGIEAVDDSDEEKEIAEFVQFCLFDDIGEPDGSKCKSWRDFVQEALTALEFGHSVFEPVHKVVMNHPTWGNYIGVRDIAYRSQKTIYEWHINRNGSINTIRQRVNGDLSVDVQIPGRNLIVLSVNKEGDNYEGISLLRPLYGNWLRKNFYFKIQAMGIERCATGVPLGKIPVSAQDDTQQFNRFKTMLKNFTSHENNYMIVPEGFEIDVAKIDFDADHVENAIAAEDRRMAKGFLAGFMELGLGGQAGSQSLGQDLSTIFLNGIEIYAGKIGDLVEKNIVRKVVDAKYGKRVKYPTVNANDINSKAGKETAEIASMLKREGLIRDSDQLEDSLNRAFNFPVIPQQQKEESDALGKGRGSTTSVPTLFSESANNNVKLANLKIATNFIADRSEATGLLMHQQLTERSETFLTKVKKAFEKETNPSKRRKILKDMKIPARAEYRNKLRLQMATVTDEATRRVLDELKLPNIKFDEFNKILKDVPKSVRDKLQVTIEATIDDQDVELHKSMFFIASQKLDSTDSVDALISDMRNAKNKYIDRVTVVGASNLVSGSVNSARNGVFQTPEVFDEIESFVIDNPSPTSAICKNLTGRVFTKDEYLTADLPPYHHNCKTTVRAQLKGVRNNKPIDPIGLTPTGSKSEIEAILKSKTF